MERGSLLAGLEFILRIMSFGCLGTFATVACTIMNNFFANWSGLRTCDGIWANQVCLCDMCRIFILMKLCIVELVGGIRVRMGLSDVYRNICRSCIVKRWVWLWTCQAVEDDNILRFQQLRLVEVSASSRFQRQILLQIWLLLTPCTYSLCARPPLEDVWQPSSLSCLWLNVYSVPFRTTREVWAPACVVQFVQWVIGWRECGHCLPWLIHGPVRSPKERFLEKLRFRCNPGVTIIDMVFKELVFHRDTFRLVRYWLHLTSDCWSCGYQFKTAGTYKILTTRLSSLQFDDGLG